MARMEETKINRLIDELETRTKLRLSVEEIEYTNEEYDTEYSYSVYLETSDVKFYIMEDAPQEAVYSYIKGLMAGHQYALDMQFKKICQN